MEGMHSGSRDFLAEGQELMSLVLDMLSGKDMWTILVEKFRMQLNL